MKSKTVLMVIACVFMFAPVSGAQTTTASQAPSAFLPEAAFDFSEVVEGTPVVHDFILLNKGTGPLKIEKVETS